MKRCAELTSHTLANEKSCRRLKVSYNKNGRFITGRLSLSYSSELLLLHHLLRKPLSIYQYFNQVHTGR